MANFIKTTVIGGLIFIIPVVVVVAIPNKAFSIMMLLAAPLGRLIPIESLGGVALVNILAVLCILVACFLAGLVAKSNLGKRTFSFIDAKLLLFFPLLSVSGFRCQSIQFFQSLR
jgi:uncharacterized membrane protein